MSFASPLLLFGLLAVPGALVAYRAALQRRRRYAVRFPATGTLAALVDPVPAWRRHLPAALFALAIAVLALATARPHASVAVPVEQASVVLVTDVSASMAANDVEPTRLDAARDAAQAFLAEVPDELRVGAVSFSGEPLAVEAPSEDRRPVQALLDSLVPDGATATGAGLETALGLLEPEDGERRPPAAIVLLSDGKNTTGRDPVEIAHQARDAGVPIYTVSLGTDSGVVQLGRGEPIAVPPDPETMREIAEVSGAESFEAADAEQLSTVYERLGSQIGTRQEDKEITALFAGGGILLLLGAAASSIRKYARLP